MPPPPNPTVFVVDDDAAVRKAVSRLLRSAGMCRGRFCVAQGISCPVRSRHAGVSRA